MANQRNSYHPRTGTKVAVALALITKQPRTARELCTLLSCTCNAVRSMLIRPLSHGVIIKTKDASGRLYFALPTIAPNDPAFSVVNDGEPSSMHQRPQRSTRLIPQKSPIPNEPLQQKDRSLTCPSNRKADKMRLPDLASVLSDGELTIAANGTSIKLNASQRRQLYCYLQKLHGRQ